MEWSSESERFVTSKLMATEAVEAHVNVKHLMRRVSQHGLPSWPVQIHVKQLRKAPHFLGSSLAVLVPLEVLVVTPMMPKAQHIMPMYTVKNLNHGGISSESRSGEAAMMSSLGDCSAELVHPLISPKHTCVSVPVIGTASFVGHRV